MDGSDPFDGDEDAALRYAIALSLQEAEAQKAEQSSSDESDDDLEKAPRHRPGEPKKKSTETQAAPELKLQSPQPAGPPSGFAALGLDRTKMEEERLARLGKRKVPDSEQEGQGLPRKARIDPGLRELQLRAPDPRKTGSAKPSPLPFPRGVARKTWAFGYPRDNDIKIEEVLQKDKLELAVLSSFQWDEEWMLSKIDIERTKMVCIAFASDEAQVRIEFPLPSGILAVDN